MQTNHGVACFKAFNILCENLAQSELATAEELNYWVFERGFMAALHALTEAQVVNVEFLDAVWSTQPSLNQDFAQH